MAMMTLIDERRIAADLSALVNGGMSLGSAIRKMHHEDGIGILWLCHAVERVADVTSHEAKRIVVKETWRTGEEGNR